MATYAQPDTTARRSRHAATVSASARTWSRSSSVRGRHASTSMARLDERILCRQVPTIAPLHNITPGAPSDRNTSERRSTLSPISHARSDPASHGSRGGTRRNVRVVRDLGGGSGGSSSTAFTHELCHPNHAARTSGVVCTEAVAAARASRRRAEMTSSGLGGDGSTGRIGEKVWSRSSRRLDMCFTNRCVISGRIRVPPSVGAALPGAQGGGSAALVLMAGPERTPRPRRRRRRIRCSSRSSLGTDPGCS